MGQDFITALGACQGYLETKLPMFKMQHRHVRLASKFTSSLTQRRPLFDCQRSASNQARTIKVQLVAQL